MIKKIEIPVTQENFLGIYLRSINGLLGLTDKELFSLECMLNINKSFTATPEIRKELVSLMGVNSVKEVNNAIKHLKDKKVIFKHKEIKGYKYNPLVVPTTMSITMDFKVL